MRVLDLFSGIGGFSLGLERCGMQTVAFCEVDKFCQQLLMYRWPNIPIYRDVRNLIYDLPANFRVDLICGGDPCPSRSVARGNRKSAHPDLAGYFLAMVGRLQPQWVVRENVPAPDVIHFATTLELLGYRTIVVQLNAKDFTSQSRQRQFVIGCLGKNTSKFRQVLFDQTGDGISFQKSNKQKQWQTSLCITSHPNRLEPASTYCYEKERGLRVLTAEEREALQGFPRGWTAGFSWSRRCVMLGNAVPPPMVEFIGRAIMEADNDQPQNI